MILDRFLWLLKNKMISYIVTLIIGRQIVARSIDETLKVHLTLFSKTTLN